LSYPQSGMFIHNLLQAVHSAQHATHTPSHDMLPHNLIINNDVISPNILT